MSFQVIERGRWQAAEPLRSGEVAINGDGRLMFVAEDLELVKVGAFAVLLADTGTLRLAVRPPHTGEAGRAMQVTVVRGKNGRDMRRRAINGKRAIKALCLECPAVKGRYKLVTKDDLLIVNLASVQLGPGAETVDD